MELTDPQRRTLEQLIGTGPRPVFPSEIAQRLRDRIEEAVRGLDLPETLWFGKEKLTDSARCEGKFQAAISGEAREDFNAAFGKAFRRAYEAQVKRLRGDRG